MNSLYVFGDVFWTQHIVSFRETIRLKSLEILSVQIDYAQEGAE